MIYSKIVFTSTQSKITRIILSHLIARHQKIREFEEFSIEYIRKKYKN